MEEHHNILPVAREIKTRAGEFVKLVVRHTISEFGGFGGVFFDGGEGSFVFDAIFELVT